LKTRNPRQEKSEIRSTKSERNPNAEIRKGSVGRKRTLCFFFFGIRISFGFRYSDFGFLLLLAVATVEVQLAASDGESTNLDSTDLPEAANLTDATDLTKTTDLQPADLDPTDLQAADLTNPTDL
jgi:hypothetical protein